MPVIFLGSVVVGKWRHSLFVNRAAGVAARLDVVWTTHRRGWLRRALGLKARRTYTVTPRITMTPATYAVAWWLERERVR